MSMFQCRLTRTQRSVFFVRVHFTMFKVQTPTELTHKCSEMLLRQQFFVDGSLALAFNWVNGCFSIVWSQGNLRGYNCCLALPSSQLCGSYDSIMSLVSLVSLDDYHITHLQCQGFTVVLQLMPVSMLTDTVSPHHWDALLACEGLGLLLVGDDLW